MKYVLLVFAALAVGFTSVSNAEYRPAQELIESKCQWIDGYYRKDGTWVKGHWRGC